MRSFGIDIIRTLGIILVIFRHYGIYTSFNWGYYAVEALFIVSGYLIGQMLFNSYFETPVVESGALKKFMIRRWLRVFPLYYFLLIVKFIISPAIGFNILFYFLFLQNHFYGVTFYPVTWTLCIEEWFYVITPLMIFLFLRLISSKPGHLAVFLFSVIICIITARTIFVYATDRQFGGITGNVPFRLDSPLIGVFLALIKYRYKTIFNLMNTWWFYLFGVITVVVFTSVLYSIRQPVDRINDYFWTRTIMFPILGITTAFILPFMEKSVSLPKGAFWKFVGGFTKWAGKLSFALYLTHAEVFHHLENHFKNRIPQPALILIAIATTLAISYVLHQTIEKKVLEWRDSRHPDNWKNKI